MWKSYQLRTNNTEKHILFKFTNNVKNIVIVQIKNSISQIKTENIFQFAKSPLNENAKKTPTTGYKKS